MTAKSSAGSWQAGIDLGTTYTAAAVHRDGRVEVVWLGERAAVVPSVVFVKEDGTIITGEAAHRQGLSEPERVAREFKRRIGDPTPLIVSRRPYSADLLTAHLLRDVMRRVTEREGSEPTAVCLTHPANWGPYKLDLLAQAVDQAGLGGYRIEYLAEPQAAAVHYATQERVEPGGVVAVYDLGGGTFDAALVRRAPAGAPGGPGSAGGGFEIIGPPQGVERLGGIDFDAAVLAHVDAAVDGAVSRLDPTDDEAAVALARLRAECTDVKEVLSADVDATVTVSLPDVRRTVRVTRAELEDMIRGPVDESVTALRRALDSAGVAPDGLHAVLLAGGSSRIPLIGQVLSAELGRPVVVDAHPKHAVAMGAALAAAGVEGGAATDAVTVVATAEDLNPARMPSVPAQPPDPPGPAGPADLDAEPVGATSPGSKRPLLVAAVAVMTDPGGYSVAGGGISEGEFCCAALPRGRPEPNQQLAFKVRDPGPGEFELAFTGDDAAEPDRITFTVDGD